MIKSQAKTKTVFRHMIDLPFSNTWTETPPNDAKTIYDILSNIFETSFNKSIDQNLSEKDIIIGFNNTMEALEKQGSQFTSRPPSELQNPIILVLVCKNDIKSSLLYSHLPTLCKVSKVKHLIDLPLGSAHALSQLYNKSPKTETVNKTKENNNTPNVSKKDSLSKTEVTIIAVRETALVKYPMLKSLYDMVESKQLGVIKPPQFLNSTIKQMEYIEKMKADESSKGIKKSTFGVTKNKLRSAYKSPNIVSLKTTTPIVTKKQMTKSQGPKKIEKTVQKQKEKNKKP